VGRVESRRRIMDVVLKDPIAADEAEPVALSLIGNSMTRR
jgi:hypothetical protein